MLLVATAGVGVGVGIHDSIAAAGTNPTVDSLTPPYGPESGGTSVTITGTNLTGATAVNFGTTPAAGFTVVSATSITATSPPGHGVVDVVVSTLAGTSALSKKDHFFYGPEVSAVSPSSGPPTGGTSVTIYGVNFLEATAVAFGTVPAASFTIDTDSTISATTPPGVGTVDVIVSAAQEASSPSSLDQFSYGPVVSSINPSSGPPGGGTTVTITGANFGASPTVNFGTTLATGVSVDVTQTVITATSPPGTGVVNVVVTTSGGTSATTPADVFSYQPIVSGVFPSTGPATGGTPVAITGSNFTGATEVDFGSVPATSVTVVSDTSISAVAPPGKQPTVPVTVVSPGGRSIINPTAVFAYSPVVAKIRPPSGVGSGGTKVLILGLDFQAVQSVMFGTTPASSFHLKSSRAIVAIAPSGTGLVDVTVHSAAGTSPIVGTDQFDYGPTITKIGPTSGKPAGGTKVKIMGTNFQGIIAVAFGGAPAAKVTVVSKTVIVAVSPPGTGTVNVTVVSLGGTSPATPADLFTY